MLEAKREAFSLRDEIGTCPYFEVCLQLRDETPFFVHPYPIREEQNFAIPTKERDANAVSNALIHRVFTISGLPQFLSVDKDRALTGQVITTLLHSMNYSMQIISPWNHGSSKAERQI